MTLPPYVLPPLRPGQCPVAVEDDDGVWRRCALEQGFVGHKNGERDCVPEIPADA